METNNKIRIKHTINGNTGQGNTGQGSWFDLNDCNLEYLQAACRVMNLKYGNGTHEIEYKFPVDRELEDL